MKLTQEQKRDLCNVYRSTVDAFQSIAAVCDAYLAMIAASDTHRIVKAPEGYSFGNIAPPIRTRNERDGYCHEKYTFQIRPIPAPCPPPKLDPVTVTVEDVYSFTPEAPAEFEAVFGQVKPLVAKGFTHYIGNRGGRVSPIAGLDDSVHRICLRKWEGK